MKRLMTCLGLGTLAMLLGLVSAPVANAQSDVENSTFTVAEPLEVGGFTLPAGTYVIRVVLLESNRNMIQVVSEDQTKVFATVLATPHPIRSEEMSQSSRYIYYATAPGQPKALRTWIARNTTNGQDIVYPRRRAMELAVAAKEPVLAIPDEVKEAEYKAAPIMVVTPQQEVKPYVQPAPVAVAEAIPPKELPRTASDVPLFAALGLLSLGAAFGLRTLANRAL